MIRALDSYLILIILQRISSQTSEAYAMFLETILQRGYINKEDVDEIQYNSLFYHLQESKLEKGEKSKQIPKEVQVLILHR